MHTYTHSYIHTYTHTHTHTHIHTHMHTHMHTQTWWSQKTLFPLLLDIEVSYKTRQTTILDCSPNLFSRCKTSCKEPLQPNASPCFQDTRGLLRLDNCRTACYSSVIGRHGQCYFGVGDMAINDRITPKLVRLRAAQTNNNGCQTIRLTLYRSKQFINIFLHQRNVCKIQTFTMMLIR